MNLQITELLFHVVSYLLFRQAIAVLASVILVIEHLLVSAVSAFLYCTLYVIQIRNFLLFIQITREIINGILAYLLFATCIIPLLLFWFSDPTKNENSLNNRSFRPILPVATTETCGSSQRYLHRPRPVTLVPVRVFKNRRLQQLQNDLIEFLFLLIKLNVKYVTLREIMRYIKKAIFATETTARAAILEKLIIMAHSLEGTEHIVQSILYLMTTYPVGMLQRENITEEMFDEM